MATSGSGFLEVWYSRSSCWNVLSSGQPRCRKLGSFLTLVEGQLGSLEALLASLEVMPLAQRFCSCSVLDQAASSSPEHREEMTN